MEIRLDGEGRLVLPAALLQELGWGPGMALELEPVEGGLRLRRRVASAAAPSPYGSATPAGVDTATLKEEARRLADAMRNLGGPGEIHHGDKKTRRGPEEGAGQTWSTDIPLCATAGQKPGATLSPYLGRVPRVPASCYLAPCAFLSGDVTLGEECSVWPGASEAILAAASRLQLVW